MSESFKRRDFLKAVGAATASLGVFFVGGNVCPKDANAAPEAAGDLKVYAFNGGTLKTQTQYLLKDTRVGTPFNIPIPFFLIKHGKDWVAFDTGNNAMVAKDPVNYWGKGITDAYWPVMKDYQEFHVQIKKHLGIEPKNLKAVILSHGHLDHAGAIDNFKGTDVPIYVQKTELKIIKDAVASGKKTAYIPEDFAAMSQLNIKPVEGVFDLFGDRSMVTFPTPGHTQGHQSLLVKPSGSKQLILAADAMYTVENMRDAIPPGLAWDIPRSLTCLSTLKIMSFMDAAVVPAHDPDYWKDKPLAPKTFVS